MRALIGVTPLGMLGLSPWIIPLIAAAAKMTHDEARNSCRGELGQNPSGDRGNARSDGRARNQQTPQERVEAKLAGRKGP